MNLKNLLPKDKGTRLVVGLFAFFAFLILFGLTREDPPPPPKVHLDRKEIEWVRECMKEPRYGAVDTMYSYCVGAVKLLEF